MSNKRYTVASYLWGDKANLKFLAIIAALLIFGMLGSRGVWTQEDRWSNIVMNMLYSDDYLHPTILGVDYYDKPLLSYWLIVFFVKIFHTYNPFILRLPSALIGYASVFAAFGIGKYINGRRLGFISAWVYLTCFGTLYWARTASTEIHNMAGILFAVWWYCNTKHQRSFLSYFTFFLIIALSCLCKGVVAAACVALVVFPDWVKEKRWKLDFNLKMVVSLFLAVLVYLIPFYLSTRFNDSGYTNSGLWLVFKENFIRYFAAFDHKGPVYLYFFCLPYYMIPWIFAFIPALVMDLKGWKKLSWPRQWLWWSLLLLFLFFTLSGSRRNYYILPLVPFAAVVTAAWIEQLFENNKRFATAFFSRVIAILILVYITSVWLLIPLGYSGGGEVPFMKQVRAEATKQLPWSQWNVIMLGARMKDAFYLYPTTEPTFYRRPRGTDNQEPGSLLALWPNIAQKQPNTIYLVMDKDVTPLEMYFKSYKVMRMPPSNLEKIEGYDPDKAAAFIPLNAASPESA